MDKGAALEIVSRYTSNISLGEAMDLINELDSLAGVNYNRSATLESLKFAKEWARDNFSQFNRDSRKIACIKVLRNLFNLSLREAKDIMDNHLSNTYVDYIFD